MEKVLYKHRIYFIGILGSSMSGLAEIAKNLGADVGGSDICYGDKLLYLKKLGIKVTIGKDYESVAQSDLVVYTAAIKRMDEELVYARSRGIPCVERAKFLGKIASLFNRVIAVSGTHGKTTVTAMLKDVFANCGVKPTVHAGGDFFDSESGVYIGDERLFITEACEYRESFCELHPDTEIILNVETDHPDYYKSMSDLNLAFQKFADNLKPKGKLILPPSVDVKCRDEILIGRDVYAKNVRLTNGENVYDIVVDGITYAEDFKLKIAGQHNVYNSLFAVAVANLYGLNREKTLEALANFKGVKRRFQLIKDVNGINIFCDYAHHPTQIKATLSAARQIVKGKIFVYFQPHTYSRTAKLMDEFCSVLSEIENLVIIKEYPARETEDMGKSAYDLYKRLTDNGVKCRYSELNKNAADIVKQKMFKGDAVLLLGAGDIVKLDEYF